MEFRAYSTGELSIGHSPIVASGSGGGNGPAMIKETSRAGIPRLIRSANPGLQLEIASPTTHLSVDPDVGRVVSTELAERECTATTRAVNCI